MAERGDRAWDVFLAVHDGLPREGPGNRASTERALALARPLPAKPRVLDIGCGPGMQTLDLAALLPDANVVGVDLHAAYVAEAARRARAAGLDDRVRFETGDMRALRFPPASFDLIWCEGAAYVIGVEAALAAWRPLLAPRGRLAFSEAVWVRDRVPEPIRAWWEAEYPAIGGIASLRERVAGCGYRLLGDFLLPREAWWDDYYRPMAARIEMLAPRFAGDPVAERVLAQCREEIEQFERYGDCYSYLFLVIEADARAG